jgi:hypothetical protein
MARFDFALWIGACLVTLHKAKIGPASLAGLNISRRQSSPNSGVCGQKFKRGSEMNKLMIGVSGLGVLHTDASVPDTDTKFRMVKESGAFD